MKRWWMLVLGLLVWSGVQAGTEVGAGEPELEDPRPVLGLIVGLKDGKTLDEAALTQLLETPGTTGRPWRERAQAAREFGHGIRVLEGKRPMSARDARAVASRLREHPAVAWVEPNVRERRLQAVVPNDPYYPAGGDPVAQSGQWWLRPVSGRDSDPIHARLRGVPDIQTAWSTTLGAPVSGRPNSNLIAVLDTGITTHPELDLGGRIILGRDFVSDVDAANDGNGWDANPADPGDWVTQDEADNDPSFAGCDPSKSTWHGTTIVGQLAALTNNGEGVAAMRWQGRVLVVRVAGKCGATVTDIVAGMYWAAGLPIPGHPSVPANPNPAKVINLSFGGTGSCNPYRQAINDLRAAGVVIVAAAGNGRGAVLRPAKCPGVIGVGAVNRDGFKAVYSSFGPELTVSTVGGDDDPDYIGPLEHLRDPGLLTIANDGATVPANPGYFYVFGSSFSAPIVAGAVSMMFSVNPDLTPDQVAEGLRLSARSHVRSIVSGGVPVLSQCSSSNTGRCECTSSTCGTGLLDLPGALAYASSPRAAGGNGGGGGGALGFGWLLALAAAVVMAARLRMTASARRA